MIPKVINYCWFGGNPLPNDIKKCIASWKKYCPDYEVKEWNETNFDVNCCDYVKEAYAAKKWAFVSDYARFKILYSNGGVYLDTDVELIKSIDDIVKNGPFMAYEAYCPIEKLNPEHIYLVNPGLGIGTEAGDPLYKEILNYYENQNFTDDDGKINQMTVVERVTWLLRKYGLSCHGEMEKVKNTTVYPAEYFCPLNVTTSKLKKTRNTRAIHWYSGSWQTKSVSLRFKKIVKRILPPRVISTIMYLKDNFKRHE